MQPHAFGYKTMQGCNDRIGEQERRDHGGNDDDAGSMRNCRTMPLTLLPITFRMPTSFARSTDCAVDRLMKLIAAMTRMKRAMPASANSVGLCARRP